MPNPLISSGMSGGDYQTTTQNPYPPMNMNIGGGTGNLAALLSAIIAAKNRQRAIELGDREPAPATISTAHMGASESHPANSQIDALRREMEGGAPDSLGQYLKPALNAGAQGIGYVLDRTKISPDFLRQYGGTFGGYF